MFHGPGKRIGPDGGPVNVWFLGDSITHGAIWNGATFDYQGSFRCRTFAAMTAAGLNPNFIGNLLNSADGVSCAGTAHTGINNASPANWDGSYFATYAPDIGATPDLVVVLLGANGADDDTQAGYVYGVVTQALEMWPNCSVALMTMFKCGSPATDWEVFNAGLRTRAKNDPRVFIVEQAGALTLADLSDGLHPTASGYYKLADALVNAFIQRCTP